MNQSEYVIKCENGVQRGENDSKPVEIWLGVDSVCFIIFWLTAGIIVFKMTAQAVSPMKSNYNKSKALYFCNTYVV